jgi:hypothetical protein
MSVGICAREERRPTVNISRALGIPSICAVIVPEPAVTMKLRELMYGTLRCLSEPTDVDGRKEISRSAQFLADDPTVTVGFLELLHGEI